MLKKAITIFVACLAVMTGILWYKVYLPLSPKLGGPSLKAFPFFLRLGALTGYVGYKSGMSSSPFVFTQGMLDGLSWIDENLLDFGQGEWKKGIDIKDMVVDGVPVIIFRPDASTIQSPTPPVVIYFHGGGLALLSPQYKSYKIICIMIAKQTKSVVISVDYRLAPENVFPAQFDDGFAVVSTVMNKPAKFGIDANRIALAGDSAGGLLSAAISLEFAKITTPSKIAAQVLIYPWLQSIDVVCLPSYQAYSKGFTLSNRGMARFGSAVAMGTIDMAPEYLVGNVSRYFMQTPYWKYLAELSNCKLPTKKSVINLPSSFVDKVTDPRLSPLLAEDVSGSPPTLFVLPDYDVLADEGKLFAKRLELAGVYVSKKEYKIYHGFVQNIGLSIPNADAIAKIAMNDMANFLNFVFYK